MSARALVAFQPTILRAINIQLIVVAHSQNDAFGAAPHRLNAHQTHKREKKGGNSNTQIKKKNLKCVHLVI